MTESAQTTGPHCKVGNVSRLWAVRYRAINDDELWVWQVYRDRDTATAEARCVNDLSWVTYVDIEEEVWTITEATPDGYSVSIERNVERVYPAEEGSEE